MYAQARPPLSIGDPTLVTGATSVVSMADLFGPDVQGSRVEVGMLGGAQIDLDGNHNTSVIGEYTSLQVRPPGSGGAWEIAINARRIFSMIRLKKRAFVGRLDFRTSPGYLDGGEARKRLGKPGTGPQLVVTDKPVFDFAAANNEMRLISPYPGVTVDEVRAEIGRDMRIAQRLVDVQPPTDDEFRIIRVDLKVASAHQMK